MSTIEEDINNMIAAAVVLGFKEFPGTIDSYICTKDQIVALCAIVAQEAIRQAQAEVDV